MEAGLNAIAQVVWNMISGLVKEEFPTLFIEQVEPHLERLRKGGMTTIEILIRADHEDEDGVKTRVLDMVAPVEVGNGVWTQPGRN